MFAVVLVGGQGLRLGPYTKEYPKAMVPIHGRPMLEYHLGWLRANDVTDVLLICNHEHKVFRQHFGDGTSFGLQLEYIVEDQPRGHGAAFKKGLAHLPGNEQLALGTYGDVLTTQPLQPLLEAQRAKDAWITVLLARLRTSYGIVDLADDGRVAQWRQKPELPYWLDAGVYVMNRACAPLLAEEGDQEAPTFGRVQQQGRLFGFPTSSYWRSVETTKDLLEAASELPREFPTSWTRRGAS